MGGPPRRRKVDGSMKRLLSARPMFAALLECAAVHDERLKDVDPESLELIPTELPSVAEDGSRQMDLAW